MIIEMKDTSGICIEDCIEEYFVESGHLARGSLAIYSQVIRRFDKYCEMSIEEITPKDVGVYLSQYRKNSATYNCNLAGLKSFFFWCKIRYGFNDPTDRFFQIPQTHIPKVRVLTASEYRALLSADTPACRIAVFLCNTGLRCREFVDLSDGAINLLRRYIDVLGKGSKRRFIPLNDTAIAVIGKISFGEIKSPKILRRRMVEAAAEAGIRPFNPHACRHFFATALLDRGVRIEQVSRLLGHASVDLTFKSYYHPESFGNVSVLDDL